MQKNAIFTGLLLFALGPIFYFVSPVHHPTAFIPSLFGIFIAAFGMAAMTPSRTKAAMHGAAGMALLGLLGSLGGASAWPKLLSGRADEVVKPPVGAAWSMLLMFCICLVFLFFCARNFSQNRRAKKA